MADEHHAEGPVDRARIEATTRIVLDVLADWDMRHRQQPQSCLSQALDRLSAHWVLVTFGLSLMAALAAWVFYGIHPLQPLEEIAYKQKEYRRNHEQREFKHKIAQSYQALGRRYLDIGQYKDAESVYTQALKFDEASIDSQRGLFKAKMYDFISQQQYDPEILDRRISFILHENAWDPHAHVFLGDLYQQLDPQKAKEHYEWAIKIDSKVAAAIFALGVLYDRDNKREDALRMYQQAVQLSPWNQKYLHNLADLYYEAKQYEPAIEKYKQILHADANFLPPYHGAARAYRILGRLHDALPFQKRLVALLNDQAITARDINKIPWYFRVNGHVVYLDGLQEKQSLVYHDIAATLYLLERPKKAEDFVRKAHDLQIANDQLIKVLIGAELQRLHDERPQFAERIRQYIDEFLNVQEN